MEESAGFTLGSFASFFVGAAPGVGINAGSTLGSFVQFVMGPILGLLVGYVVLVDFSGGIARFKMCATCMSVLLFHFYNSVWVCFVALVLKCPQYMLLPDVSINSE